MYKESAYLNIPIILRFITIWYEVFFKLGVSIYVLVNRKKLFLESSHRIDTNLDVVVEVLKLNSIVSFEFYLDE